MNEILLEAGSVVAVQKGDFDSLLGAMNSLGYNLIGPAVRDDAIVYAPLFSSISLPQGYISEQDAGHYRLIYTGHGRYFDVTPGAQTWKQFLFPARAPLYTQQRKDGRWQIESHDDHPAYALIGVRPCELAAIQVQDRVFLQEAWSDPIYRHRRQRVFIVSVDCLHPCGTCFCDSIGTGPKTGPGFDLNLTEFDDLFLAEAGSETGKIVLSNVPYQPASAFLLQSARRGLADARKRMGRTLPDIDELPEALLGNLDHTHWDDVARRCLSCGNCTQVCPTCFCWDVQDSTDLQGTRSHRERIWDSCFNPDYSYIAGGNTRPDTRSRYRQWLTHKLASWKHQFDVLGCVGCGRCITWCPAGIDLTVEVAALRREFVK